jgi:transposase
MDVVFDRVAGLDIGKKSVVVCVRTPGERGRRASQIRTFGTMTRHVDVLGDWLVEEGVQVAAMESTATYWKPVFCGLEDLSSASSALRRQHDVGAGPQG